MTHRFAFRFASALALLNAASHAGAIELHVPQQFPTIQSAIDAAPDGARVLVAPGTYRENLLLINRSVKLESVAGAAFTTIDGGAAGPVIYAAGTGTERVTIKGLTLTNGKNLLSDPATTIPNPGIGGGVYLEALDATVADNVIASNVSCVGLGISTISATVRIQGNRVIDNSQDPSCEGADGGGILIRVDGRGDSVIRDNEISRNRISGGGAGIAVQNAERVSIRSNVITGNNAGAGVGGGIFINVGSADIVDNVITRNAAAYGGGVMLAPIDIANRVRMKSNLLAGNTGDPGAGVYMFVFYDHSVQFENNTVQGQTQASLVQCDGLPFTISRRNVLVNIGGPELGGTCMAGR